MTKTVLITGGSGFLGSHFCDFMISKGMKVICMDNLITGNKDNIKHLMDNENFTFIEHDVTKYIDIKEDIDYILHLSSPASPIDYLKIPIQTLTANSIGTHNALGLARAKNARFLLASTSEIYGDPLEHPQKETYAGNVDTMAPRSCYDEAQRFAESITIAYHRFHKVDAKIVRIFNTYGPRMRANDGRVMPAFINQALNNEDITMFGNGEQTRSFCYVTDLIEGIYRLLMSDINEPVNIGNPSEMSMMQLAEVIIKLIGSTSKITYKDLPIGDPKVRKPDITKAKELLKWEPKVDLEYGLGKTIEYFKK